MIFRPFLFIGALFSGAVQADTLTLTAENQLLGEVASIKDGVVTIGNANAVNPLKVKLSEVRSLDFQQAEGPPPGAHQQVVNLRNGDQIPGELTFLDDRTLKLKTWYAGDLEMPRTAVESLYFGVRPQRVVFRGPGREEDWTNNNNWEFRNDEMFSTGQGNIVREVALPEQFIVSFELAWDNNPNFVLRIGGDHAEFNRQKSDAYLILYNNAGLQVQRYSPKSPVNYKPIIQLAEPPNNFPDRSVTVELHVNRRDHEMVLYFNGKNQGRFIDPQQSVPSGNYLILESRSAPRAANKISRIEIREWDAISQNLRKEDVGDPTQDSVSTAEGDRYGGELIGFNPENGGLSIRSPLAPEVIEIPLPKISVLNFKTPAPVPALESGPQALQLRGGGMLRVNDLTLEENIFQAEHPILGPLSIRREALLEVSSPQTPAAAQK